MTRVSVFAIATVVTVGAMPGVAAAGIPGSDPQHGCITNDGTIWNAEAPWGPADGRRLAEAARNNTCGNGK